MRMIVRQLVVVGVEMFAHAARSGIQRIWDRCEKRVALGGVDDSKYSSRRETIVAVIVVVERAGL